MSIRHSGIAIVAGACWALASCAAPKPTVVEPPTKPVKKTEATADQSEPGPPKSPMRIGDMLELPKDSELRATNPGAAADKPGGAAVIVSPPPQPSEKKPETTP